MVSIPTVLRKIRFAHILNSMAQPYFIFVFDLLKVIILSRVLKHYNNHYFKKILIKQKYMTSFDIVYIQYRYTHISMVSAAGLNSIWLCKECRANFLFYSDVEEHMERTGHSIIQEYEMSSGKLLNGIDV